MSLHPVPEYVDIWVSEEGEREEEKVCAAKMDQTAKEEGGEKERGKEKEKGNAKKKGVGNEKTAYYRGVRVYELGRALSLLMAGNHRIVEAFFFPLENQLSLSPASASAPAPAPALSFSLSPQEAMLLCSKSPHPPSQLPNARPIVIHLWKDTISQEILSVSLTEAILHHYKGLVARNISLLRPLLPSLPSLSSSPSPSTLNACREAASLLYHSLRLSLSLSGFSEKERPRPLFHFSLSQSGLLFQLRKYKYGDLVLTRERAEELLDMVKQKIQEIAESVTQAGTLSNPRILYGSESQRRERGIDEIDNWVFDLCMALSSLSE